MAVRGRGERGTTPTRGAAHTHISLSAARARGDLIMGGLLCLHAPCTESHARYAERAHKFEIAHGGTTLTMHGGVYLSLFVVG